MKLTDTTRLAIAAQLVTNALNDRRQQLAIDRHELALMVYNHFYRPTTRKAMEKLPDGWLQSERLMPVKIEGELNVHHFVCLPAPRRMLAKHTERDSFPVLSKDGELAKRLKQLDEEARAIEDTDRKLRVDIRKLLRPITTLKQLGECWPEALPVAMGVLEQIRRLTPPEAQAPQHTPPAELNAALRLKPVSKPAPAAKKPTGKATRSAQQAA